MSDWSKVLTLLERAVAAADQVLDGGESEVGAELLDLPTTTPTASELRRLRQALADARRARQALEAGLAEVRFQLQECRHIRRAAGDYGLSNRR